MKNWGGRVLNCEYGNSIHNSRFEFSKCLNYQTPDESFTNAERPMGLKERCALGALRLRSSPGGFEVNKK
jgi:hypothetical protein